MLCEKKLSYPKDAIHRFNFSQHDPARSILC